jgi:hypothetical protein
VDIANAICRIDPPLRAKKDRRLTGIPLQDSGLIYQNMA